MIRFNPQENRMKQHLLPLICLPFLLADHRGLG